MNLLLSPSTANNSKTSAENSVDPGSKANVNPSAERNDFAKAFDKERNAVKAQETEHRRHAQEEKAREHQRDENRDTRMAREESHNTHAKTSADHNAKPSKQNVAEASASSEASRNAATENGAEKSTSRQQVSQNESAEKLASEQATHNALTGDAVEEAQTAEGMSLLEGEHLQVESELNMAGLQTGDASSMLQLLAGPQTSDTQTSLTSFSLQTSSTSAAPLTANGISPDQQGSGSSLLRQLIAQQANADTDSSTISSAPLGDGSIDTTTSTGKTTNSQWLAQAMQSAQPGISDKSSMTPGMLRDSTGSSIPDGGLAASLQTDGLSSEDADLIQSKSSANSQLFNELIGKSNSANALIGGKNAALNSGDAALIAEGQLSDALQQSTNKTMANAMPASQFQNAIGLNVAGAKPVFPVNVSFGQPEWAGMVAERSAMMAAQSIKFAELQLDPPELGPLQVKVSVNHDNQASISFVSANAHVREALDLNSSRLRELLQEQGVDLVDVDVSDQQSYSQGETGEQAGGSNSSVSGEDTALDEETTQQTWIVSARSGVDYYA
ncbi:Flagellar hook-length control protein [Thalassocella blandensis]|nr:Flagellar hook-length control protein [Thalassocella blandensis]